MARKTTFIPYKVRTILNKHKRPDHWFWTRYTSYPYIGCQHGCEFCYCRETKYALYADITDFPYVIKVKQNAPLLFRKALSKLPRDVVAVGDYQPAEKKFELSRRMLEICLDLGFPVFILERSPLVLRDLDLLEEINKKTHVSVLFSLIHTAASPHADQINAIEHLAPKPERRLWAMEKIAAKGIQTGISFMPILPDLCDTPENIQRVIQAAADHGGSFVLGAPLTLADQQKEYFLTYLKGHHPDLHISYVNKYPPKSYGPAGDSWIRTGNLIRETCQNIGISDRMPRLIFPGEKRALNKQVVEVLANKLYSMELESTPDHKMWPVRRAAWALEDLEQDISLIYKHMGLKGLESIPQVGLAFGKMLEEFISSKTASKKELNNDSFSL
jgi:DNA repair photolyase